MIDMKYERQRFTVVLAQQIGISGNKIGSKMFYTYPNISNDITNFELCLTIFMA